MRLPEAQPVPGFSGAFFTVVPLQQPPELGMLHPPERDIWDGLETESRRREWWAGRIAARSALTPLGAGDSTVSRDDRGVPTLQGPNAAEILLSISHGRRLCAAAAIRADANTAGLGIDLVEVEDLARLQKLKARVLAPGELEPFGDEDLALAAAWGAREAVAKATATGMWAFAMSRVHLEAFDPNQGTLRVDLEGARLSHRRLEDDALLVFALVDRALVLRARAIAER